MGWQTFTEYYNKDEYSSNRPFIALEAKPILVEAMIAFAKAHVEAALRSASDKVWKVQYERGQSFRDEDSILNAYPLTEIK